MNTNHVSPYSPDNPHPSGPFASPVEALEAMLADRRAAGMSEAEAREDVRATFDALLAQQGTSLAELLTPAEPAEAPTA